MTAGVPTKRADGSADGTAAAAFATIGQALDEVAAALAGPLSPPARQEARDLIAAVLDVPRFWPTAHATRALTVQESDAIAEAVARRLRGMPLEYAVRRAAFRQLSLYVDERVLIPRQETEFLVEIVLEMTRGGAGTAIDVGTGSGAIALALASEGAFARVIATDISVQAIAVATLNAARIGALPGRAGSGREMAATDFRVGSYLAPCRAVRAEVVVSNPPYIALSEASELPASVRNWEPPIALFADDGGIAAIAAVAQEAAVVLVAGGLLALEVDSRRAGRAADAVELAGAYRDVTVRPDLAGRARYVLARRVEE